MNIADKDSRRWTYAGLWLPVLLAPVAYLFLAYVGEGAFRRNGLWHFVNFIFPFCVLFCIHHFLLVRKLFMRNRMKSYFMAVVLLLGAFVVLNNLQNPHPPRPEKEWDVARDKHSPLERPTGRYPEPPPRERLQEKKRHVDVPAPMAMDLCIALLLVGANLSVAFFLKYVEEKERNIDMEKNHLQQELEYLKAQLNPHFFMNMLNNIHGMIELDPSAAQEMIVELSRLMRYVLYEGAKEYIPLATETDFIKTYVTLMRKRYSNKKVSIELRVPPPSQTKGIMLPPLLFIVLVENAFKHGISYLQHSSFDISLDVMDGYIRFYCCNNRVASPETGSKKYGGIGLNNLRKRLELLYGQDYSMEISNQKKETYAITLTIPYNYEADTVHSS